MPVSAAVYIGVIASLTGWTEDHIRWHLPLSRGWAYFHTHRTIAGESRVWLNPSPSDLAAHKKRVAFLEKFKPGAKIMALHDDQ